MFKIIIQRRWAINNYYQTLNQDHNLGQLQDYVNKFERLTTERKELEILT